MGTLLMEHYRRLLAHKKKPHLLHKILIFLAYTATHYGKLLEGGNDAHTEPQETNYIPC